jgi:DNA-binding MarR family transcriptional regulator
MKNNNFYTIQGWMVNDLKLKGNELICYAVIYCFSQDEKTLYMGGVKYLEGWMNATEPTVLLSLDKLIKKGFIRKHEVITESGKRCYYAVTKESLVGGTKESLVGGTKESLVGGTKESLVKIYNNKEINKEKKNILSNDNIKSCDSFDIFWKKYHKGSKKNAFKSWGKLNEQQREKALNNVDDYLLYCKRSDRPLKDASTYLNGECFNDDWLEVPECYRVTEFDNERIRRFKEYMVNKFPDLIYHRNPLTFEQGDRLMEDYGVAPFEEAMRKLCGRDIHQYYSIKCGVEAILKEIQDDDI